VESLAVVILAAGKGTRMGGNTPKVLSQSIENTLLTHVLGTTMSLNPERVVVVTGFGRELVEAEIAKFKFDAGLPGHLISTAHQEEQLGTGHAVKIACSNLADFTGTVLILYGDVPLITEASLSGLLSDHQKSNATLSLLTVKGPHLKGHGRIIRNQDGSIQKIVEYKDCSPSELFIDETNPGIYAVDSAFLQPAVNDLKNENAQKEYYLPDIIERAVTEGQTVSLSPRFDAAEFLGVNTPADLASVNSELYRRKVESLMAQGVTIVDPRSCFIDPRVSIGAGSVIGASVTIKGNSKIGEQVTVEGSAYLIDTTVESGATLRFCVRSDSAVIGAGASVGPFAHLRAGTVLGESVHVGNFVETKNAALEAGVKAGHLSYLGDCSIGQNTNIGAGTITANYDGFSKKSRTTIGRDVSIGSDTTLIAPVTVGDSAAVGAGSTIRANVEAGALCLTRGDLKNIPGWAAKKRAELDGKKS
jgi:bifunctional UDP-N-acetylglucosamine pyrophosphorylase / glucosamine-1-phosphate N-acetyltransferase